MVPSCKLADASLYLIILSIKNVGIPRIFFSECLGFIWAQFSNISIRASTDDRVLYLCF
jgi:hypothetical protein